MKIKLLFALLGLVLTLWHHGDMAYFGIWIMMFALSWPRPCDIK